MKNTKDILPMSGSWVIIRMTKESQPCRAYYTFRKTFETKIGQLITAPEYWDFDNPNNSKKYGLEPRK